MVRALGLVYFAGPTVAAICLLLPHPARTNDLGIWGMVVFTYAVAPVIFTQYRRLPPAAVSGAIALATTIVFVVVCFDGAPDSPYAFFFLWVPPFAMVFFSTREGVAHLAYVGVAYAAALAVVADGAPAGPLAIRWLHLMAALSVFALLVRALERELRANLASVDAERRRRALEINDDVVQRLVLARQSYAVGERGEGDAEVAAALDRARTIMADLVTADGVAPGALRRATASTEDRP